MKSFCGTLLLSEDGGTVTPELEERVKWIAASMYGGEYLDQSPVSHPNISEQLDLTRLGISDVDGISLAQLHPDCCSFVTIYYGHGTSS